LPSLPRTLLLAAALAALGFVLWQAQLPPAVPSAAPGSAFTSVPRVGTLLGVEEPDPPNTATAMPIPAPARTTTAAAIASTLREGARRTPGRRTAGGATT
jgi:hypothetical protein